MGLYGILAQVFPSDLRATGTGFAVGNRPGRIMARRISRVLFHAGYGLNVVATAIGIRSLVRVQALWFLPFKRAVVEADAG